MEIPPNHAMSVQLSHGKNCPKCGCPRSCGNFNRFRGSVCASFLSLLEANASLVFCMRLHGSSLLQRTLINMPPKVARLNILKVMYKFYIGSESCDQIPNKMTTSLVRHSSPRFPTNHWFQAGRVHLRARKSGEAPGKPLL